MAAALKTEGSVTGRANVGVGRSHTLLTAPSWGRKRPHCSQGAVGAPCSRATGGSGVKHGLLRLPLWGVRSVWGSCARVSWEIGHQRVLGAGSSWPPPHVQCSVALNVSRGPAANPDFKCRSKFYMYINNKINS